MDGNGEQIFTETAVEAALDNTIAALMVLDGPMLAQLAELWGPWEVSPLSLSVTGQERERLHAKLALLGRLLRQTAVSLNLLGVLAGFSERSVPHSSYESHRVAGSVNHLQRGV